MLLGLSTAEMNASPSAPAWVRYCPWSFGEGDEETIAAVGARALRPESSTTHPFELRRDLTVGVHAEPYHCSSWVQEQVFSLSPGLGMLQRVSVGNRPSPPWVRISKTRV
jgi:hypothetical protein